MHLKIYRGPETDAATTSSARHDPADDTVTVAFGEVLPLIADAIASERTWLKDFEIDDITITRDLYEVLSAYQYFRRPSA